MIQLKTIFSNTNFLVLVSPLLMIFAQPVLAKDYKVEVLIFENLTQSRAFESHNYETPEAMLSNSDSWIIEPTMLVEDAEAVENSDDYMLLQHYSWGQESLPYSKSTAFQVVDESLNGWFKIYATQLLFANIDIDFNGYRMNEKRRLKLDQKHFFDHPKFGILMQVSRLEKTDEEELTNLE